MKLRLDAEARSNGRTLSQEAEVRLERSFDRQDILGEVLALRYGSTLAAMLARLGYAAMAARRAAELQGFDDWHRGGRGAWLDLPHDDWPAQPVGYEVMTLAVAAAMSALRPARGEKPPALPAHWVDEITEAAVSGVNEAGGRLAGHAKGRKEK